MPKRRATSELSPPPKKREKDGSAEAGPSRQDRPETVPPKRRAALLAHYPSLIPDKLTDLDKERFTTIPSSIASRAESETGAHVTKDELVTLVEWKLKHGTFRPALLGMAKQHPPELVVQTSAEAFALLSEDATGALRVLTALKGIGPATASLILSCANTTTPFFSDELFRWVMWEEPGGGGWKRRIKYTEKEYRALVEKVQGVLEGQEDVTAFDLEKIASDMQRAYLPAPPSELAETSLLAGAQASGLLNSAPFPPYALRIRHPPSCGRNALSEVGGHSTFPWRLAIVHGPSDPVAIQASLNGDIYR